MISALFSVYSLRYPIVLVYMLQNTEYRAGPYLAWYWRTQDFSKVIRRRELARTRAARLLLVALSAGMLLQIAVGLLLFYWWFRYDMPGGWAFGLALVLSYPIVWAHLAVAPLVLGRTLVVRPRELRQIIASEKIFRAHKGVKIAIAGSYGKTSMKELLLAVLGAGKNVAATPANKNVAASHAAFARTLSGDEDILLVEYGEGAPGDVAKFARTTHPDRAVITGVAAAHLDRYKSTEAAGKDIFSVVHFIGDKRHVYANGESLAAQQFIKPEYSAYNSAGALGWQASNISVSVSGLSFTLSKGKQAMKLSSGLLGRHNIGPISLAAGLAHEFGINATTIQTAVAATKPFEHRMQPYVLNGGWVIDDTYNGNIEGVRAGTALLRELPAERKLYVTPGLVDQGRESRQVHKEMGRQIANSGANTVVLMQNSTTKYIQAGLEAAGYKGEVIVETDPLMFYTNLDKFVAAGDIALLQNDWPDNYA